MKALTFCALVALAAACDSGEAPGKDAPVASAAPSGQSDGKAPGAVTETGDAKVMDDCPGKEEESCSGMGKTAEGQREFGTFALTDSAPLSKVAAAIAEEKKTVQVTGTVDSVCQKKGCWMVLKDGDVTARVFTHSGEFFLPTDTEKGRTAVVEGEIEARTMSEKFAKHLAEDQGQDPAKVSGPQKEIVINATAIALK